MLGEWVGPASSDICGFVGLAPRDVSLFPSLDEPESEWSNALRDSLRNIVSLSGCGWLGSPFGSTTYRVGVLKMGEFPYTPRVASSLGS